MAAPRGRKTARTRGSSGKGEAVQRILRTSIVVAPQCASIGPESCLDRDLCPSHSAVAYDRAGYILAHGPVAPHPARAAPGRAAVPRTGGTGRPIKVRGKHASCITIKGTRP